MPQTRHVGRSPRARPATRQRRTSDEVKGRLLQAAREEFERCGFAGATTASIARRAEVTEAQLFRHFGSKANLFSEAVFIPLNQHFVEFNAEPADGPAELSADAERTAQYIEELQQFLEANSKLLMSLAVAEAYDAGSTRGVGDVDSLQRYFERGAAMMAERLDPPPCVDPALTVRVAFASVLGTILFRGWLFPPGLAPAEQIRVALQEFVIHGMDGRPQPGPELPARTKTDPAP